jgi:hypothetical protein
VVLIVTPGVLTGMANVPAAAAPSGIAGAASPATTWDKAIEVPGTATLDQGGSAQLTSVSCGSAGNCGGGGFYADSSGYQAFVVSETNGTWGAAIEVPGTAARNTQGRAAIASVSCPSAGNCVAGGYYADKPGGPVTQPLQPFVVTETNGTWGTAVAVPGSGTVNKGLGNEITSVSCASVGNCSAGGGPSPSQGPGNGQAFVVGEKNGTWGKAIVVPGLAALNTGDQAYVNSVSCASASGCSAGGYYTDSSGGQTFVVSETSGTWGTAIEVPGTPALNKGGDAQVGSVSCGSAGNCSAGGYYRTSSQSGAEQAFVVTETNGIWGTADAAQAGTTPPATPRANRSTRHLSSVGASRDRVWAASAT